MSAEGEVEKKVRELGEEVFDKYNPGNTIQNDEGEPYISKEDMREFIKAIMERSGEVESWSDEEFQTCYLEFDRDGSGKIERSEFDAFIKRFADL